MSSYSFSGGLALAIGAFSLNSIGRTLYTAAEFRRLTYAARARLATLRRLRRIALRCEIRRLPETGYAFPDSGWLRHRQPAEAARALRASTRRRAVSDHGYKRVAG